jgi:diguanylate cyclase
VKQFTTFGASGYAIGDLHLFQGTAHQQAGALLAPCPVIRVAEGQKVPNAKDKGARLYFVLRGALNVLTAAPADMQSEETGGAGIKVLPGECVGELSILNDDADHGQMSALQDSEVLVIQSDTLWKLIDEANGVARNLLHLLSLRINAANAPLRKRRKAGAFHSQQSLVDGLTGLQNRTWLNDNLPTIIDNAHVVNSHLSIIRIDIDHFTEFNDAHGALSGDHALQVATKAIRSALRPTDFAVRFDEAKLIVILPATQQKIALMIAQRLRDRIRQALVFSELRTPLPHITASFGVATLEPAQNAEALLASADSALGRAKEDGHDRVAL